MSIVHIDVMHTHGVENRSQIGKQLAQFLPKRIDGFKPEGGEIIDAQQRQLDAQNGQAFGQTEWNNKSSETKKKEGQQQQQYRRCSLQ